MPNHRVLDFTQLHKAKFNAGDDVDLPEPEGRGDVWYSDDIQTLYIADDTGEVWDVFDLTILGGTLTLNDLSDVNTSGVTNGQYLVYNSGSSMWVPGSISLALQDLTDVANFTAAKGDLLARNSTIFDKFAVGTNGHILIADSTQTFGMKWAVIESALNFDLAHLTDVDATGWSDTYVLTYSSGSGKWEAAPGGGGGGGNDDGARRLIWMGW